MNSDSLKVGDIVKLKSGSPEMTVINITNTRQILTVAHYDFAAKAFVTFQRGPNAFEKV